MSIRMLADWLFATLAFALAGWAGHNHWGGDPDHWRMVFILATGAYTAGHWQGHYLGRHDPRRLDRDLETWAAREHWRG